MLARCARTSPCLARFGRESSARSTWSVSPSVLVVMPSGMCFDSSPLGPLTLNVPAFWASVTPLGMGSGFLPIRDMTFLPDLAEELAAEARLAGGPVGHEALRRRQDGDAEARANLRDAAVAHVHALARTGAATKARDGVRARIGPAQADD